jgi:ketosteroid isomerase-like protein
LESHVRRQQQRGETVQRSRSDVIKEAYAAFNRREIDAVLALMTPDVDWPNGMEGGRVVGHDQVRDYWTRQWSVLDPRVDPVNIGDESGKTVVRVRQVVRDLSGNVLVDHFVLHVYSFSDDLIDRMDIREASESASPETVSSRRL